MNITSWHRGGRTVKPFSLKLSAIGIAYPLPASSIRPQRIKLPGGGVGVATPEPFAGEIRINLTQEAEDGLRCTLAMGFDEAEEFARNVLRQVAEARAGSVSRDDEPVTVKPAGPKAPRFALPGEIDTGDKKSV